MHHLGREFINSKAAPGVRGGLAERERGLICDTKEIFAGSHLSSHGLGSRISRGPMLRYVQALQFLFPRSPQAHRDLQYPKEDKARD